MSLVRLHPHINKAKSIMPPFSNIFYKVTILLPVVAGRKLDLQITATRRPGAQASWLGQVLFTTNIGYRVAIALAMSPWQEHFA